MIESLKLYNLLLVACGGALGGMGRLAMTNLFSYLLGIRFPWGTLIVNLTGAFIAGWLAAWIGIPMHIDFSSYWLAFIVGLLGGYTTVSSFSLQTLTLWQSGEPGRAVMYFSATLLLGLLVVAIGWWIGGLMA